MKIKNEIKYWNKNSTYEFVLFVCLFVFKIQNRNIKVINLWVTGDTKVKDIGTRVFKGRNRVDK